MSIVALPEFLEYASGFKSLNHLILDVDIGSKSFRWVDIKAFTAKGCINLDSIASMNVMFDYAQSQSECILSEEELDNFSKFKFGKAYSEVEVKVDVLYSFVHQMLQGKLVDLEQQLTKSQHLLKKGQIDAILDFQKSINSTPVMNNQGDWVFILDPKIDYRRVGPQLPTEMIILQSMGIGNVVPNMRARRVEYDSVELRLLSQEGLTDKAWQISTSKLNYSYRQYFKSSEVVLGQYNYQTDSKVECFGDALSLHRRLAGKQEEGEKKQANHPLNVMLKFLHFLGFVSEKEVHPRGCVVAEHGHAHSQQMVLLLHLLSSGVSHIFYDSFYNYYLQHDALQPDDKQLRELYAQGTFPSMRKQRPANHQLINLIARVFTFTSRSVPSQHSSYNVELLQFVEILNHTTTALKQLYDAFILHEYFDKVQHKDFANYTSTLKPSFNHLYTPEHGQQVILFLLKPSLHTKPTNESMHFWDSVLKALRSLPDKNHSHLLDLFN